MIQYRDTDWTDPRTHRELIEGLAKCIASTAPEHHAELCRTFRIPPSLINQQLTREG